MSFSEVFNTGYLRTRAKSKEEIFLSVTPRFERGPGIQRDGLTLPRMTDPHMVQYVTDRGRRPSQILPPTTDQYVQRAGTWTLFHHVGDFIKRYGNDYLIIGVQSCGDLTMNPWHIALIHSDNKDRLCRLETSEDNFQEPYWERTYRCLVKWTNGLRDYQHEFIDLQFAWLRDHYSACIGDDNYIKENTEWFEANDVDPDDISGNIEFALSGKPIIQKGIDIELTSVIDRFQDVRHVFNVPTVPAHGAVGATQINRINFGEYTLYTDLNARRAALNSAVIIDLRSTNLNVEVKWEELSNELEQRYHYILTKESPTRRGQYSKYAENSVEIFYPHNVYPFGVIGGKAGELVCLASGGLSGRVGTTLDGITRVMYDFFGCEDALVLDEGNDTFHIGNPNLKRSENDPDNYKYNNEELLEQIARFTLWMSDKDNEESKKSSYPLGKCLKEWPLNREMFQRLDDFCSQKGITAGSDPNMLDVMFVPPHRSQMRAVMIFAINKESYIRKGTSDI